MQNNVSLFFKALYINNLTKFVRSKVTSGPTKWKIWVFLYIQEVKRFQLHAALEQLSEELTKLCLWRCVQITLITSTGWTDTDDGVLAHP